MIDLIQLKEYQISFKSTWCPN